MTARKTPLPAYVSVESIPSVYRWLAPVYDAAGILIGDKARGRALELAQIADGESILEAGVGTGLTFREVVRRNPNGRNEGIDITPAMLRRAKRRMRAEQSVNYRLRVADALTPPFAEETFDCVVSTFVLGLLSREDMSRALGRWAQLLRPNGRIVLVYQVPGTCWYEKLWDETYRRFPRLVGGCRGVSPAGIIDASGLRIVRRLSMRRFGVPHEIVLARPSRPARMSHPG